MPRMNLSNVDSGAPATFRRFSEIPWSPQQLGVFDAIKGSNASLRIDAVAGAGKTTTLEYGIDFMQGPTAAVAFNRRIAEEFKHRVRRFSHATAGTLHSFGFKSWLQTAPDCTVDGDKLRNLANSIRVPWTMVQFTTQMVSHLKGGVCQPPVERDLMEMIATHYDVYDKLPDGFMDQGRDPFQYVNELFQASIDCAEDLIDFDDMLYMPLVHGRINADFDNVLIDEAQDTNAMRRLMVRKLCRGGGRVIAVGDPHQAIYGFTGADSNAMDLISSDFQCQHLPLTVTYRCPRAIVEHARQWVSHITAAPEAPEGQVIQLNSEQFEIWLRDPQNFNPATAILCRNTRPIIDLALSMLRRGIGARVEGRDIGQSLATLANRWKSPSLSHLLDRLEVYRNRETQKFRQRQQLAKAAQVEDRVDSLLALLESMRPDSTVNELKLKITTLFGDTQPGETPRVCTLSTVHKAKGREWDRVYFYGREALIPSRYAKQDWELQQEANLAYVGVTRAKKELVEVAL